MLAALAVATSVAGLGFSSADAQVQMKIVSGDGPQHEGVKAYNDVAKWIEEKSDGRISTRVFPQTLLSVKEIPSGLRDGVADMGLIVHPYHPAEFPEANFIADFSLFATNNYAAAGAASEYIFTCEECMAEMASSGLIYLGNIANAPYYLLTKEPITTLADLKGKKIRSGGEAWGRWIEAMGAVKITIPAADTYEA
jgi:TRAP-type C4-dicarboxylate transport system substrate-binding protein